MSDVSIFSRIRTTFVEPIGQNQLRARCILTDTLTEAAVEVSIRAPELEIVDVKAKITRAPLKPQEDETQLARKIIGVRLGPGMKKIIRGLIGEADETKQLAFMIEECCNAVILSLTKEVLLQKPQDKRAEKDFYRNIVKQNMRLYNRCAAFAPGSSLLEGIEPPA